MGFDREQFIKERDEALLSLDKRKILAYAKKYGARVDDGNGLVFWAAVHKAILGLRSATPEQKARSADWLIKHGFRAGLGQ